MIDALEQARGEDGTDPRALGDALVANVDALVTDYRPAVLAEMPPGVFDHCSKAGLGLLHALSLRSLEWVEAALAAGAPPTVASSADAEVALVPGADLGKYGVVRVPAGATARTLVEKALGRLAVVHKLLTKKGSHPDSGAARAAQLERLPAIVARLERAEQPDVEVPDEPQEVELAETSQSEAAGIERKVASGDIASPADLEAFLERRARRLIRPHAFGIALATKEPELRSALVDRALEGADGDVLPYEVRGAAVTVGQAVAMSGAERHLALAAQLGVDWFVSSRLRAPVRLAVERGHLTVVREALRVAEAGHEGILRDAAQEAARRGERAIYEVLREAGVDGAAGCLGSFVANGWMDLFEETLAAGVDAVPFGLAVQYEGVLERFRHHGVTLDAIGDQPQVWRSIAEVGTRTRDPFDLDLWQARVTTLLDLNRLTVESAFRVIKAHGRDGWEGEVERSKWILDQVIDRGIDWAGRIDDEDGHTTVMDWALAAAPLWLLKHLHERGGPLPEGVVVRGHWVEADAKRRWLETVTTLGERTLVERLEDPQTFDSPSAVVARAVAEDGTVFGLRLGQSESEVRALGLGPGGADIQSFHGPGEKGHRLSWELEGGVVTAIRYLLVVAPAEKTAYAKAIRARVRESPIAPDEAEVFTSITGDGLNGMVELLLERA